MGATIAIGTLIFTGCSTYYQAQVARDQLEQSRKAAERDEKDHASRITYWTEPGPDRLTMIHILNTSPDPVAFMEFTVSIYLGGGLRDLGKPWGVFSLSWSNIAPCSELVFSSADIRVPPDSDVPTNFWGKPLKEINNLFWKLNDLGFLDRNGEWWARSNSKYSLRKGDPDPPGPWRGFLDVSAPPQINRAPACGGIEQ
ncbi:hypothetical protein [Streptomyces sp. NPDC000229]|uniref:hypothetical protein n=1 Tax=Streptomyces sp. NPDC000229 TaxID=3154247 RepID=UPI0033308FA7